LSRTVHPPSLTCGDASEKMPDVEQWLSALEERHLANLTRPELTRALRALSSCYVERRDRLAKGAALDGSGKRAAFALFYGPLHFITVTNIVHALGARDRNLQEIADLGCGTGAAGAAWAMACSQTPSIAGIDRSAWAVQEANWTYRHFTLKGRAAGGDVTRAPLRADGRSGILLAYAVNELPPEGRAVLLERIVDRTRAGAALLIVEPIARRGADWWNGWRSRLVSEGARADEWRFAVPLPPLLRGIARGAGLDPRELTARTISKI
jgi:predicted RNA methylase